MPTKGIARNNALIDASGVFTFGKSQLLWISTFKFLLDTPRHLMPLTKNLLATGAWKIVHNGTFSVLFI